MAVLLFGQKPHRLSLSFLCNRVFPLWLKLAQNQSPRNRIEEDDSGNGDIYTILNRGIRDNPCLNRLSLQKNLESSKDARKNL